MRAILVCLLIAWPARAAVVVVINNTEREQSFAVRHTPKGEARSVSLASGEFRLVPVGKASELRTSLNGRPADFKLDAYSAYVFARDRTGQHVFHGVQLAAPLPKADDLPDEPVAAKPFVVPVRIFADDAEKRAQPVWEKALRTRLEAAAVILAAQTGVRFEFAAAGEWKSDPASRDLGQMLVEFEQSAERKGGELLIGFTARELPKDPDLALTRTPFTSHILIKEGKPRTESERVEVLAHQLGQYLGAVRSADATSIMRVNLKDGGAARARHPWLFDPLNLIAMQIWVAEANAGGKRTLEDLRPPAKQRLHALYKTQAAIHESLKSEDTQAKEYAAILEPGDVAAPEKPAPPVTIETPEPKREPKAEPPGKYTPLQQAVRMVVKGVVIRGEDNARLPLDHPKKLSQDALTAEYIRVACDVASGLDEKLRVPAFLIGIGIALDDSPLLRSNILTRAVCAAVESAEETKARLAVLGSPTIRNRRDLCQHYVVSMALVGLRGEEAAELAGIAKEIMDMKGTSGFSFVDLAADMAGVELARRIIKFPFRLDNYAKGFQLDDHIPDLSGLREGLNEAKFSEEFRSTDDAKFKAVVADIRGRIAKLGGFSHAR